MLSGKSKYLNGLTAYTSFIEASLLRKPVIYGMPPAISFELTNYCNLKCPECPSGSGKMKRSKGFMPLDLFSRVIDETKSGLFNINLYFQGEPMLHPEFFDFLEKCRDIYTTVSTNGHFISDSNAARIVCSGLNKLIISVDGLDQETYSRYRVNGNLARVLQGLNALAKAKMHNSSEIRIVIQFLVNRINQGQVSKITNLARELKVELALKSMQLSDDTSKDYWLPSGKAFRRYRKAGDKYLIRNHLPRRCLRAWFNPVITWDGKVLPCCFDKDGEYLMGDLYRNTFREIWHGQQYEAFRNMILAGREKIEMCQNCTSGLQGVKK